VQGRRSYARPRRISQGAHGEPANRLRSAPRYLRASERLHPLVDLLKSVVGLGFSGLVCMPLIIAACYLHRNTRMVTPPSSVPRWLVWVPLAMVLPLGSLDAALGMLPRRSSGL